MRDKESYRDNLSLIDTMFPGKAMLTMRDTAQLLGIDYKTLLRYKVAYQLPYKRIGKGYYISKADIARFIS